MSRSPERNSMDTIEGVSESTRRVLELAGREAGYWGRHNIVTTDILTGLLVEGNITLTLFQACGTNPVDLDKLRNNLRSFIDPSARFTSLAQKQKFSVETRNALTIAAEEARREDARKIQPKHLLIALIKMPEGYCAGLLKSVGLDHSKVEQLRTFTE